MPTSSHPMTDQRLAEIQNRRLDDVTPGPWLVSENQDGNALVYVERQSPEGKTYASVLLVADWATEADVQFVASARCSVPDLLDEVVRLRERAAELEQQVATARTDALNEAADWFEQRAATEPDQSYRARVMRGAANDVRRLSTEAAAS